MSLRIEEGTARSWGLEELCMEGSQERPEIGEEEGEQGC